ncbi:MAG TPA: SEC-C metal-binding domain-containing protein [Terriglobia bacterium]|nr:SEC-C metal-binding domain-containing protein [Terriglobia bacterium]
MDLQPKLAPKQTESRPNDPIRNPFGIFQRNKPCPCRSGRKFKACCLQTIHAIKAIAPKNPDVFVETAKLFNFWLSARVAGKDLEPFVVPDVPDRRLMAEM